MNLIFLKGLFSGIGISLICYFVGYRIFLVAEGINNHIHEWDRWEQITLDVKRITHLGQGIEGKQAAQKRSCKTCGKIEMEDIG